MRSAISARVKYVSALAILPLLSGCYDYPAVATLSSTAVKAVGTWQPFVDDYAQSCKRAYALGAKIPGAKPGEDPCANFAETQKSLGASFTVLTNYFNGLNAIALDSNYSLDPGLDSLGAAVGKVTDASEAGAVTKLSEFMADWAAAGVRARSLDQALSHINAIKAIVTGVQHVIVTDYQDHLLKGERGQFQLMMGNAASDIHLSPIDCAGASIAWGAPQSNTETASQVLFQSFYNDRCNALLAREAALKAFVDSANKLQKSLDDLNTTHDQLKTKKKIALLLNDAKILFTDTQAVQKAFAISNSK